MKNEKMLPKELLFDLLHFIPFDIKWSKIRISKLFDIFLIKFQRKLFIYLSIVSFFMSNKYFLIFQ